MSDKLFDPNYCYVIAEAGLNHNGSLETAKALIDVASLAKVDAVKFQKRTIDCLAVKETLDKPDDRFPEFGSTYREIREHLEFSLPQYRELKSYADSKGLDFMCTAFDLEAVDFLKEVGVEKIKLASHSLTNLPLLKYVSSLKKAVVLSTGMAELDEIDTAIEIFKREDCPLVILHCVSSYPTPLNECNLKIMQFLKERYQLPTGYSGHEIGYFPTICAVAMGAEVVERHFTLDKNMVGFDHKISLEPHELISMVREIRNVALVGGQKNKKVSEVEKVTRNKYHVSMVSNQRIPAGTTLTSAMINWKNPGTGIPVKKAHEVLGKVAKCDIQHDVLITFEMFE